MFLLNDRTIIENLHAGGLVQIEPFSENNLCPTYYYFRFGGNYQRWSREEKRWIEGELDRTNSVLQVQGDEYLLIQSMEHFKCSKRCLALFGASSRLIRKGLSLRNSPFIDPNFPEEVSLGALELGLKNELNAPVNLYVGESIGKMCFFNVGDTFPVADVEGTPSEADYERRSRSDHPQPLYEDDPVYEFESVEEFGKKKRREQGWE